MKATVYNPFLKRLRTDGGFRLEFDFSESEYDSLKDIIKLQNIPLEIEINEPGQTKTN